MSAGFVLARKFIVAVLMAAGLAATASQSVADEAPGPGYGRGPGMMGGNAPRYDTGIPPAGGYGPGYGMGSGRMHGYGYGMGPGAPGGYGPGYGRGMPGYGYGMGPGMMGGYGPGYGMGPGMMGGYGYGMGPEMMGGYGPGYGMGPGMMGGYGYGMGQGMTGGYGPGYGMGPGMMGGYGRGMGPGMGYGAFYGLDLTDEQRAKIDQIHEDVQKRNYATAERTAEAFSKLRNLLASGKRDRKAMAAAYKQVSDLRYERLQARLDAQDRLEAVLNNDQREQLRRWRPWGCGASD